MLNEDEKLMEIHNLTKAIYVNDRQSIDCIWIELSIKYSDDYLSSISLIHAVAGGHTELAIELINLGADVNYIDVSSEMECCSYTPLTIAASHNNVDMLKLLIQHGADPKLKFSDGCFCCSALDSATKENTVEAFQYILSFYEIDSSYVSNYFKMAISVSDVNFSLVKQFVIGGCNVNAKFDGGGTPLIEAVKSGFIETVRYLVEVGADVNLADDKELTPLLWATYYNLQETIDFLIPLSSSKIIKLVEEQIKDIEALEKLLFE